MLPNLIALAQPTEGKYQEEPSPLRRRIARRFPESHPGRRALREIHQADRAERRDPMRAAEEAIRRQLEQQQLDDEGDEEDDEGDEEDDDVDIGEGSDEGDEEDDEGDEEDDEGDEEDEAGVRIGKFGKLEVVRDGDGPEEDDAPPFDIEQYRRAIDDLRKGIIQPSDLEGILGMP
jgi:hypothetical protein